LDYAAFLRSAERAELPPVVLIHGSDAQLLDDALVAATRALFSDDPGLAAMGREVLDARETPPETVAASAMTLPLVAARRLVAVRHAQALAARSAEALIEYLKDPNPTACLLLLADDALEAGRDGKPHWLVQAVPRASIVALPTRRGRDLEAWLVQRAGVEDLEVSDDAARLLVEWVGDDTAALLGETRKAALAGGATNRSVGVREVTAVVGAHRVDDVFELTRSIERRDVGLALRTLDRLLSTEEPIRLLALLATEVRLWWSIQELGRRGQSVTEIARTLRRPPGVVAPRLARVGDTTAATLAAKLSRCWAVELRLKSGGEPRAELTALVAELCS
jgi:DNA polymerase III subunit delta